MKTPAWILLMTVSGLGAAILLWGALSKESGDTSARADAEGPVTVLPDEDSWFRAAKLGNIEGLEERLRQGVPIDAVNPDGYSALIFAAYYGREPAVQFLVEAGANPCQPDLRGNTALMGAIFKGHFGTVRTLLGLECAVDQRNAAGQTALMFGALFGRERVVNALVAHGANPAAADAVGHTAASVAEGQGHFDIADRLR